MFITSQPTVSKVAPEHSEYQALPIAPDNANDVPAGPDGGTCRALFIGGAGNVNVNLLGGGTAVLTGLATGQIVVVGVARVLVTSTTATGIKALY